MKDKQMKYPFSWSDKLLLDLHLHLADGFLTDHSSLLTPHEKHGLGGWWAASPERLQVKGAGHLQVAEGLPDCLLGRQRQREEPSPCALPH